MSRERTPVKKIREILRYKYEHKMSNERIALSLNVSKGTVHNIINRFITSNLPWPLPTEISDTKVEKILFERSRLEGKPPVNHLDMDYIKTELSKRHMTKQRLYEEYCQAHPQGIKRSQFYKLIKRELAQKPSMHIEQKGGDLLYVDYSGDGLEYVDKTTGECIPVELFICSWGASSYCYAECTKTQNTEDFVAAHNRAFAYFGAVPHGLVPDNLKSAVIKSDRYDPITNPLYTHMAQHYKTTILPARVRKPKDKAIVESNVLHIQRFILARLRNEVFYSLADINAAVYAELELFNTRPMKDYGDKNRKQRFEEFDKPYALPLPKERFTTTRIKQGVRVAPNYHIRFDDHYYSVPHQYVKCTVDVYLCGSVVEIYHDNKHLCRHLYSSIKFKYTTVKEHMPYEHQFVKGWSKEYFLQQGEKIGPATREVVKQTLEYCTHPQQGFNTCLGILKLSSVYSNERLENACERALFFRSAFYKNIKSILEQNLDNIPYVNDNLPQTTTPIEHENVRGANYYQTELELHYA